MSYRETKSADFITIRLECDARKGKGICGSVADVTMQNRELINQMLYLWGWRLMRGHQVCGECMGKKKVVFPRADAQGRE